MILWKRVVYYCSSLVLYSFGIAALHAESAQFLHPFVSMTAGEASISNVMQSQTFSVGSSSYAYAVKHAIATPELIGGSLGTQLIFSPNWELQLGLAYYKLSSFAVKGVLTQGSDAPALQEYNYSYNLLARQILLESKILIVWHKLYHPYFIIGLGEAFNLVNQYQTDAPLFLVFTPMFAGNTNRSFSYSLGLGIDVDVLPHLRAGVGYRFADFGKANLGSGSLSVYSIPYTLKQRHLYTNELLAQLTWIL